VIAAAEYVWDDRGQAHRWLTAPHAELDNRSPLDIALTDLGARQLEMVLDRIFYGLPA
jgi:putative toxin-antitoxin system antitoxin component (TIGR02293 family)